MARRSAGQTIYHLLFTIHPLNNPRFVAELLGELRGPALRVAVAEELCLLLLEREVDALDRLELALAGGDGGLHFANLLLLRGHDALERGVANLADARLDGQQRRRLHRVPLIPAALQLALDAELFARPVDLDDDGRVRQAE